MNNFIKYFYTHIRLTFMKYWIKLTNILTQQTIFIDIIRKKN